MPNLQPPSILPQGAVRVIDKLLSRERRDTCTIQRPVSQEDAAGAQMESAWYTVAVVDCEIGEPQGGSEAQIAGRSGPEAPYAVSVPRSTDIRSSDRILPLRTGGVLEVIYAPEHVTAGLDITVMAQSRS